MNIVRMISSIFASAFITTIITCTARIGGRREGEGSVLRLLQRSEEL